MSVRIAEGELDRDDVAALLASHLEHMHSHSPPCKAHALPAEALAAPGITFYTVRDPATGDLMGCGALKELSPTTGEVKSMRTADTHLGRGVGRAMLEHIVATAVARGYRRISLETGSTPGFDPARRLYEDFGFEPAEPFAEHEANGFNRFYTLTLSPR